MYSLSSRGDNLVVLSRSKSKKWPICLFALLIVGLIISCAGMQESFNVGNRQLTLIFALSSGVLCVGSCLCFFALVAGYAGRKAQASAEKRLTSESEEAASIGDANRGEYVARHAVGAKITILCLVAGLASTIIFFLYHPASLPIWMWVALAGLLSLNCIYAYRVCLTTVRFTSEEISMRIAPFIHFSEEYSDITELKAKTGNLKVRFKDGKSMSLWSGLGNFNEIASILMEKTDVLPS
jgi:hypothetical protein